MRTQRRGCGRSSERQWRRTSGWLQGKPCKHFNNLLYVGKPGLGSGCDQLGGELLTLNQNIAEWWTDNFEELLFPTNTSPMEEAESEDLEEALPIFLAEVAEVVNKFLCGKALRVVEIRPEVLKALDIVELS